MTQCAKVSEQQQNVWCEAENMNHFEGQWLIQQILPRFYWQMVFVSQHHKIDASPQPCYYSADSSVILSLFPLTWTMFRLQVFQWSLKFLALTEHSFIWILYSHILNSLESNYCSAELCGAVPGSCSNDDYIWSMCFGRPFLSVRVHQDIKGCYSQG